MSSKFRPSATPRVPPSWCKPAIYSLASGMQSPLPNALNGFAEATESILDPPLDVHESFCLDWDAAAEQYQGRAGPGPYEIELILQKTAVDGVWDIYVKIYKDGEFLDQESWHNQPIQEEPIFDSGFHSRIFAPLMEGVGWQATG